MKKRQTHLEDGAIAEILDRYSLGFVAATPLYIGMDNINIKVTDGDGRRYVLKICSAPAETVREQLRIMRQCGSSDQQPLSLTNGESIFFYGERVGYVLPYIEGNDLLGIELDTEDIRKIAQFHREAARRIGGIRERPMPNIWDLSNFHKHLRRYDRFVPAHVQVPELDLAGDAKVTVHNDFTRSNLLRTEAGGLHLLDFGDVAYGNEVTDLAVALAHFCVEDTPDDQILPQLAAFLAQRRELPEPTRLYHLIRLRFIQAITLTLYEEETLGSHPRAGYWMRFGEDGLRRFGQIGIGEFVAYLSSAHASSSRGGMTGMRQEST